MSEPEPAPKWLVANLKEGRSPIAKGAKCYCLPARWGDGYDRIKILVRSRGGRWIEHVLSWKLLTNWRMKEVFEPAALHAMRKKFSEVNPWENRDPEAMAKAMLTREAA